VTKERGEALSLIDEAVSAGCRCWVACREVGLDPRTVQRWRKQPDGGHDARRGPLTAPAQKLTSEERAEVLDVANSPEFRNLSPKQIVPRLADRGEYIASESTFYRVLHAESQMAHRGSTRPATSRRPEELLASGSNQVWSWDITYLPGPLRGKFYYLYLFVDVWSRRIMKAVVHSEDSSEFAADLLLKASREYGIEPWTLTVHADNGGAMKGSTMLATMQSLGIVPSFSRPSVSDDNPYSEALFRTLKHVPFYPRKPFASLDAAWAWVERFVAWYNGEHCHSAIGFVTPNERHAGKDVAILRARRDVYERARKERPERWARAIRKWDAPALVALNPRELSTKARATSSLRCGAESATSMVPATTAPSDTTRRRHHASTRAAA
jgi:putative transposase